MNDVSLTQAVERMARGDAFTLIVGRRDPTWKEGVVSRFGCDDYDEDYPNQWALWQHNLERHMNGPQGQRDLLDLHRALLALPERKLIGGRLADERGGVCAVGALALARRCAKGEEREAVLSELAALIPEDDYDYGDTTATVGRSVGLKYMLAWTIGELNDDFHKITDEERFERVLKWVEKNIQPVAA
jgi:hypothetical protein